MHYKTNDDVVGMVEGGGSEHDIGIKTTIEVIFL